MIEDGDVIGHIKVFDQISNELLNVGVKMEEKDKSLLLLCVKSVVVLPSLRKIRRPAGERSQKNNSDQQLSQLTLKLGQLSSK